METNLICGVSILGNSIGSYDCIGCLNNILKPQSTLGNGPTDGVYVVVLAQRAYHGIADHRGGYI